MDPALAQRLQWLYDASLACAERVQQALGAGMPIHTYQACLKLELEAVPLVVQRDVPVPLVYRGVEIPDSITVPLVVDGRLVISFAMEPNMSATMDSRMHALLRATGLPLGVIANFGVPSIRAGWRRIANPNPSLIA